MLISETRIGIQLPKHVSIVIFYGTPKCPEKSPSPSSEDLSSLIGPISHLPAHMDIFFLVKGETCMTISSFMCYKDVKWTMDFHYSLLCEKRCFLIHFFKPLSLLLLLFFTFYGKKDNNFQEFVCLQIVGFGTA